MILVPVVHGTPIVHDIVENLGLILKPFANLS